MGSISRHGSKHGVVAVLIAGGNEEALFPLCKQRPALIPGEEADAVAEVRENPEEPGQQQQEEHNNGETEEALISLANEPLLLYPLLRLEELFTTGGMQSVAVACTSEEAARSVRHWIHQRYASQPSRPHVIAINGRDNAEIVAQAFHQGLGSEFDLAESVIVVHGNLVCDVQLEAVVAAHKLRKATATVMLAPPRDEQISTTSSKKGGTIAPSKSKSKAPKTFVGLDSAKVKLCLWMSESNTKTDANGKRKGLTQLQLPRRVLKHVGHVTVSSNLVDTQLAVFNRDVFDGKDAADRVRGTLSGDLIPGLVKQQFEDLEPSQGEGHGAGRGHGGEAGEAQAQEDGAGDQGGLGSADGVDLAAMGARDGAQGEEGVIMTKKNESGTSDRSGGGGDHHLSFDKLQEVIAEMSHGHFHLDRSPQSAGAKTNPGASEAQAKHAKCLCTVYLVPPENYCAMVDTIETYGEVSKDLTSPEFAHLLPAQAETRPQEVGSKTTLGAGCLFAEGVTIGDKCSVKRSVVGARCAIGNNVKIVNSVIMDDVAVGDGTHVQNCVLCNKVRVGEKCTLKDCHVGAQWVLGDEVEHRGETLAHANIS